MKTQREIMNQRDENKCKLLDEIEKLGGEPIDMENARRLSACMGAYKALCMEGAEMYRGTGSGQQRAVETPAHTPELDGDTEFERVVMSIPEDKAHMVAVIQILNDHMTQLAVMHRRSYDNVMLRLREVAQN